MIRFLTILTLLVASLPFMAQKADDGYPIVVRDAMRAMRADSLEKADSLIHQAMRIRPADMGNAVLYQYLGEIRMRQSREDEAMEAFNDGLRMTPENQTLLLDRASLYIKRNELGRALQDLNDCIALNRDEKQALFYRAYVYHKQHMMRNARYDYEHLIELEPENLKVRLGLALLNADDNRPQEAMDEMNMIIRYWPKDAVGYAVRGGMYTKRREYEPALKDLNKAIELEPGNPDYYISRALLYKDFKKTKQCRDDLRMAVQLGANAQECAQLLLTEKKK